jgi:prolipoprotein diacylglyceryltransferase
MKWANNDVLVTPVPASSEDCSTTEPSAVNEPLQPIMVHSTLKSPTTVRLPSQFYEFFCEAIFITVHNKA